ncbi:histidine phosphatase family protein [Paenibacillus senegalensis]|uniref:histidine phosphatase family protein n=1 Tax=Paenibacillus senegalensis TaxID=1465766 RepID=UPI00028A3ED5|nr:histidine phosphatase family protein [Paenibacillus senegalensis]
MTTIAFVRHGNTAWNIEKRAQGHSHNPLNATGFKQAEAIGKRLAKEEWDVLISSDLLRARQTAEIIASYVGMPIIYDQRIREISRGQIEGTIEEERVKRWGKDWGTLDLGEETEQQLRARGVAFVKEVLEKYKGKRVLVVTHGKFLIQTLHELCPETTDCNDLVHNCSVTILKQVGTQLDYVLYNCTAHLQQEELTH